jgi:hypothetical protein
MASKVEAICGKSEVALVQQELKPGETLLWSGCCKGKRRDRCRASGPMSGVVFGGIVGFILGILLLRIFAPNAPAILLVTVPLGSLWLARGSSAEYRKDAAVYALTDRRVFSASKLYRTVKTATLPLDHIGSIRIDYRDYHRHTLHFHARMPNGSDSPKPSLRFRLVRNDDGVLPHLRRIKPDVVVKPTPPIEKTPRLNGIRKRLHPRRD